MRNRHFSKLLAILLAAALTSCAGFGAVTVHEPEEDEVYSLNTSSAAPFQDLVITHNLGSLYEFMNNPNSAAYLQPLGNAIPAKVVFRFENGTVVSVNTTLYARDAIRVSTPVYMNAADTSISAGNAEVEVQLPTVSFVHEDGTKRPHQAVHVGTLHIEDLPQVGTSSGLLTLRFMDFMLDYGHASLDALKTADTSQQVIPGFGEFASGVSTDFEQALKDFERLRNETAKVVDGQADNIPLLLMPSQAGGTRGVLSRQSLRIEDRFVAALLQSVGIDYRRVSSLDDSAHGPSDFDIFDGVHSLINEYSDTALNIGRKMVEVGDMAMTVGGIAAATPVPQLEAAGITVATMGAMAHFAGTWLMGSIATSVQVVATNTDDGISAAERQQLEKPIEHMLDNGVINPLTSEVGSSVMKKLLGDDGVSSKAGEALLGLTKTSLGDFYGKDYFSNLKSRAKDLADWSSGWFKNNLDSFERTNQTDYDEDGDIAGSPVNTGGGGGGGGTVDPNDCDSILAEIGRLQEIVRQLGGGGTGYDPDVPQQAYYYEQAIQAYQDYYDQRCR